MAGNRQCRRDRKSMGPAQKEGSRGSYPARRWVTIDFLPCYHFFICFILLGSITHLSFPTRSHLISASEDGTICIFRARDWSLLRSMKGHKGRVNSVAVHPSNKIALSVGKDRTLRMWDLMRGKGSASTKLGKGRMPKFILIYDNCTKTPNQRGNSFAGLRRGIDSSYRRDQPLISTQL